MNERASFTSRGEVDNAVTLRQAARDSAPITEGVHAYYRYPARFSPAFASAAIRQFSTSGDIVLDPFMGGGTTVVEALRMGRQAFGSDINELSLFLAKVKSRPLSARQEREVMRWAKATVPSLRFNTAPESLPWDPEDRRARNLSLPRSRPIKKLIALALGALADLDDARAQRFVRCALLGSGQWALNGRRDPVDAARFRHHLLVRLERMVKSNTEFRKELAGVTRLPVKLRRTPVADLHAAYTGTGLGRASLVVTSPPYPGVHVLYHRWQIDGRRESPAPYLISGTNDGMGSAYYNMGDRRNPRAEDYFRNLRDGWTQIRKCLKKGGAAVQMVAFAEPRRDLPRYLEIMEECGFQEAHWQLDLARRIWRDVPNRSWHATAKGHTSASREVVLIHEAV